MLSEFIQHGADIDRLPYYIFAANAADFQQIINDKLKAVAAVGEMNAIEKEKTPTEYWEFVRRQEA